VIVDSHAHIFPPLAEACGFPTVEEHRRFLQLYIATHSEPVRRLRDHAEVPEAVHALYDGEILSLDDLKTSANFRVGRFGRFEWEWEGETYYRPFLPPSLQEMVTPPEFIVQEMGRAGVDIAILQNAGLYGRLNDEFAAAMRDYPGRFIGLADVRAAEADGEAEADRLTHAIRELGLRGVYYANRGLIACGYGHAFDDPRFDGYWETVHSLGIPVFWEILGTPMPTAASYLSEIDRLNRWSARFPEIPCLLTHGFGPEYLTGTTPEPIVELLDREQVMVEVLFPIHWGRLHDYPYLDLRPALQRLLDLAGPSRLVWGSDMPNVARNCTYRQSLTYLFHCLDGLVTERELDAILGENVLELVSFE
jgi:predicted TIM-barrel fold metal-dependent hydrolase